MSDSTTGPVYKIAPRGLWLAACATGHFTGSPDDLRDGFIHFSTRAQLAETARRHFNDLHDLVLIEISPAALGPALKWEPSRGGALFPHLYAPLPTAAATWVRALPLNSDGVPDVDAALQQQEP